MYTWRKKYGDKTVPCEATYNENLTSDLNYKQESIFKGDDIVFMANNVC